MHVKKSSLLKAPDTGSLDVPLYSLLFPQVSVIPKAGCRNVEHAVRGLRESEEMHWLQVWGIVDNDRRSKAELDRLRNLGVHSLSHFSVESIYYHPEMIRRIATRQAEVTGEKSDILYKQAILGAVQEFERQKDYLVLDVVDRLVRQRIFSELPTRSDIQTKDFIEVNINVAEMKTTEENDFDVLIAARNLDGLLKRYSLRKSGAPAQIAKVIGLSQQRYTSGGSETTSRRR